MAGGIVPPNAGGSGSGPGMLANGGMVDSLLRLLFPIDAAGGDSVGMSFTPNMPTAAPAGAPARPAAPAPAQAAAPVQSTVPGALRLPKTPSLMDTLHEMMGPSISPSQEGAAWSPSQGPGDAVTDPGGGLMSKLPSILSALSATGAGGGGGQMSAPSAPTTRAIAPGALPSLLGGGNPLAAEKAPLFAMLSRLLGGR